jgi:hypothetical protein
VSSQYAFEMNTCIHDLLAEIAALKARVHELTIDLELAQQMARPAPPVSGAA